MTVKRIVSNVGTSDVDKASAFYKEILGLEVLMDLAGYEPTLSAKMTIQVSVMSEAGRHAVPIFRLKSHVEEALRESKLLHHTALRLSRGSAQVLCS